MNRTRAIATLSQCLTVLFFEGDTFHRRSRECRSAREAVNLQNQLPLESEPVIFLRTSAVFEDHVPYTQFLPLTNGTLQRMLNGDPVSDVRAIAVDSLQWARANNLQPQTSGLVESL